MSDGLQQVINYMIPAVGTPRGYFWNGVMNATPETIDFRAVTGGGIDGQPFRPSGVFIDNTRGTAPLALVINEISYQIICLAGELLNVQFPAPVDVSATFTGFGEVTLAFVDFPVLPYRNLASVNQNILWGNIAGTLSNQADLNAALLARILFPTGGAANKILAYQSAGLAQWIDPPATGIAFQDEGAAVVTSGTLNVVGAGAAVTNVGGVATLTVPNAGTDLQARAGSTRFVVPGTYVDPSATSSTVNRNAMRVNGASSDARALNAAISGLNAINKFSGFNTFNFTALPATGSVAVLQMESFSSGDSLIWLVVNPNGSIAINRDNFFTTVSSAAGVVVAGTTYRVAVTLDFSAVGGVIKVTLNETVVISTTATAAFSSVANTSYRVASFGPATANGVYSRAAIWSGLLTDAEAVTLTQNGDPQGITPATAVLRAYWKLEETTGTNAPATVGGVNMTLTGAGATWSIIPIVTALAVGTPVRVASAGATGAFATHENDIAIKTAASWDFLDPSEGWLVYDQTTNIESRWGGAAWTIYDQEGTFVATLGFQTPGDQSIAYNFNTGIYQIKNGWAHVHYDISATVTHTTASGDFQISGSPVTPLAGEAGVGALVFQGITKANYTNYVALAIPSNPVVISASGSGQNTAFCSASDIPSGGTVLLRATISFPL